MSFGAASISTSTTTRYLPPGYLSSTAPTTSVDIRASEAFSVTRLSYNSRNAGTGGNTVSARLRKNGSIVGTITHAATSASGTGTFTQVDFAQGDRYGVQIDKSGTIGTPDDYTITLGRT